MTSSMKVRIVVFRLKGERSHMIENALATLKAWSSVTCHRKCSRDGSRRGIFLRKLLSVRSRSSTPCNKTAVQCPSKRLVLSCLICSAPLPRNLGQPICVNLSVGIRLLLQVPGLLDRRRGVGRVGSHTTSATVLWRGPGHLDQPDPLPWEIWARPIGYMQR
jgi:hypothetical protein